MGGGGVNLHCMNGSENNTCRNEFIFQVILSNKVTPSKIMAVYLSEENFLFRGYYAGHLKSFQYFFLFLMHRLLIIIIHVIIFISKINHIKC